MQIKQLGESAVQRSSRTAFISLAGLALAVGLAGCSGLSESLGFGKKSPDEFTVVRRAPLVLPPNYNLRPPQPGAPRPQEPQPSESARAALLTSAGGGSGPPASQPHSTGEAAILRAANADAADPNIRQIVERETTALVTKNESFTDRLLFWREPQPQGEVVDPAREASRIRENQATGRPVVEGTTPVIRHRKRGLLEGIF